MKSSEETRNKISKALTGRKLSIKTRIKMRQRIGEKSPIWKGDDVGYTALHDWVRRHKGKPNFCEMCGKKGKQYKFDWANKSGIYRRSFDDFMSLCVPCHSKF